MENCLFFVRDSHQFHLNARLILEYGHPGIVGGHLHHEIGGWFGDQLVNVLLSVGKEIVETDALRFKLDLFYCML